MSSLVWKESLTRVLKLAGAIGVLGVIAPSLVANGEPGPDTGAVSVPARFKAENVGGHGKRSESATLKGAPWWLLFHDPTLEKLEQKAVSHNQDLRQAVMRVLEARAQASAAAAGFYPTINAPLRAGRQRLTGNGPIMRSRIVGDGFSAMGAGAAMPDSFAGQTLSDTISDFSAQIALGYEIDAFGRIRHTYGQARANAAAIEADRQSVELSLTSQVAATYFTLRAIDSQAAVLRHTLRLRTEAVQIQKERLDAGVVNDTDFFRAQAEQASTEADLAEALQQRTELENTLAVLCGEAASDFHLAEKPLEQTPPPAVPATVPAQLLTQRPDMVAAERLLIAGSEGIKSARAQFLPTIQIGANYGYESADSDLFLRDQSHAWSITGAISIPIFEGGLNKARLKAAQASHEKAFAAYRQTALVAFKDAENALSALRQRATQAEARGRVVENARHVSELTLKSYREGAINYFEVIDAQRILLNAELSQVHTLNARYNATIDLIRAIGGGYERSALR